MLALLFAGVAELAAQTGPVLARASSVSGAALVYTASSGGALALSPGFLLSPGDRLDTRGGGRVVVDLSDGSMVVVEPQSLIVLKDYRQAGSLRELFEILVGTVRVKINQYGGKPNPYRMNSPTASIAVRGTEFTIEVSLDGGTRVTVFEGVVEVTSLSDPNQSVLVEAGRGVLVQAGQDFHLLGAGNRVGESGFPANILPTPGWNPIAGASQAPRVDRDELMPRATANAYDSYVASLSDIEQAPFLLRFNAFAEGHLDSLENPAYATQFSTAEARVFLLPTVGGGHDLNDHRATLGPVGMLPGSYSLSPQLSIFSPLGNSGFYIGGSISGSHITDSAFTSFPDEDSISSTQTSAATHTSGYSSSNFYSGSLVAARRFGSTSLGVELESFRGSGSLTSTATDSDRQLNTKQIVAASQVSQRRATFGLSHNFGVGATLSLFYRYGWISGDDHDLTHTINNMPVTPNATNSAGHSSEIGFRFRGVLGPRLLYGITGAWLGLSLSDHLARTGVVNSDEIDRGELGSMGLGIGYLLSRHVLLTVDTATGVSRLASSRTEGGTGNLLQNGTENGHFFSGHAAVLFNLSRHLFTSVSFLNIWHAQHVNVNLFPDQFGNISLVQDSFLPLTPTPFESASHFSDFGVGWRFSSSFFAQYLFTTDYGVTSPSHTVMLRYTIKLRKTEKAE